MGNVKVLEASRSDSYIVEWSFFKKGSEYTRYVISDLPSSLWHDLMIRYPSHNI